ncbi:MAG TPA: hypothetical protein VNI58_06725 [Mariprofundaceae bacterium]|nr:hypothetical protein [Mariprofundaceae bacterium]
MTNLPSVLRFLLGRFGLIKAIMLTTFIAMVLSVAITVGLMHLFGLPDLGVGIALSAFCPFVMVPWLAGFYLRMIERLDRTNRQLEAALAEVRELRGLLPICSSCKKIRDDQGYWNHIESYISAHSRAEFTHSICPDCATKLYGELMQ